MLHVACYVNQFLVMAMNVCILVNNDINVYNLVHLKSYTIELRVVIRVAALSYFANEFTPDTCHALRDVAIGEGTFTQHSGRKCAPPDPMRPGASGSEHQCRIYKKKRNSLFTRITRLSCIDHQATACKWTCVARRFALYKEDGV